MGKNALALLCVLILCCCTCCGSENVIRETMTPERCKSSNLDEILWISETTSAIIIGKSKQPFVECQMKFGLATKSRTARLRLHFDFIYIHDCGIELQVNESSDSFFSPQINNHQMIKSQCKTKVPGPLHAQPKYFVLVSLQKKDKYLEAYNFRLNISMIESLPVVGPAFHTLVITGLVMVVAVGLAATLFLKYLAHVTQRWHEMSVENAMDRAIYIYNSQEPLQEEPDLVCLQPGHRSEICNGARRRTREPEIAFVHPNGRVERFRPLGGTGSSEHLGGQASGADAQPVRPAAGIRAYVTEPQQARSHIAASKRAPGGTRVVPTSSGAIAHRRREAPDGDTASLTGCELPPSYEEALGLPVAGESASGAADPSADPPEFDNFAQRTVGLATNASDDMSRVGRDCARQQDGASASDSIDYINVRIGGGGEETKQEEEPSTSTSEAPLLPSVNTTVGSSLNSNDSFPPSTQDDAHQ